jgi:peptidoglycan/xylan/chitin deacetylase (PgdA/CDA1 family)
MIYLLQASDIMRIMCFTVDFDRDVNLAIPGRAEAGSLDRGSGTDARFSSSVRGARMLSGLLDEIGVPATYFAEGRTLEVAGDPSVFGGHEVGVHGYDHEDLERCGDDDVRSIIERAKAAVRDVTGRSATSFRAPYMRPSDRISDALPDAGIKVDSSRYSPLSPSMIPYTVAGGRVTEIPVPEGTDSNGKKISAYLWPMHEGRRSPEDYLGMASEVLEGVFVLATHTWHVCESRSSGVMDTPEIERNIENMKKVLEGLLDMGYRAETVSRAADAVGSVSGTP